MRVLVFGIHPDDVELGCGGTLAVCARRGDDVTIVDLTRGESSSNGTPEVRAAEAQAAAEVLGVTRRVNLGLPDAGVRSEDPEQRRAVTRALREFRPHVVLVPNEDDPHPDHASGGQLIHRAIYLAGIHGYFPDDVATGAFRPRHVLVYSGRNEVRPDVVVDTSEVTDVKRDAIRAHRTQFDRDKGAAATPINADEFLSAVEARDRVAGYRIRARAGEAFQLATPLPLGDLGVFGEDA